MAVPPAKGLDEACAWLRKAALTPFPPVTKSEQDYGHGRNKIRTRAKLRAGFLDFVNARRGSCVIAPCIGGRAGRGRDGDVRTQ